MPPPWLGTQVVPSSSVNAERLSWPVNWATKVRLVKRSVKRIASRLANEVVRKLTSSQVTGAGGEQSLKVTRSVGRPALDMTFLVFQSTPQEGSPAPTPFGFGLSASPRSCLPF